MSDKFMSNTITNPVEIGGGQDLQQQVFEKTMEILISLSTFSPIVIVLCILFFSFLTGSPEKMVAYFIWICLITFFRIIALSYKPLSPKPASCPNQLFNANDVTYSTYILSFTLMYFLLPMILVSKDNNINMINYGMVAFFISYIILDIFIKKQQSCFTVNNKTSIVAPLANVVIGFLLGMIIAGPIMYNGVLKPYLYINEITSNKEVCAMPSQQQFRCNVYKNGELVGSSVE